MTVSSLEEAMQDSDKENNPTEPNKLVKPSYQPKWVSSIIRGSRNEDGIQDDTERLLNKNEDVFELSKELLGESDLPDFADDECRELSRQIKLLEAEREKVSKESKDHKERISTMKDHMTTVKQEISHSNHLLSAKNKDISMEAHLIALQDREKARILSDIKDTTLKINNEENRLKNIEDDLNGTNKSIEKLKLALNWNQEELEQRVSAAKQYEKDKIDLERYTRGDEVKVKAALLKLERVTKLSIETQALLDNEVTEAQTKHQEVERMTNTLKIEHEDRRKLLQNWQNTIQAMKDRDSDINAISMKYANSSRRLDEQQEEIRNKNGQISTFQTMVDSIKQEIEINEKLLQNRRQERIDAELSFRNVCDQLDQLKRDHVVSLESLQQAKNKSSLSKDGISQKSKQLDILRNKYDAALKQLEVEKMTVLSKEKATQLYEDRLHEKEEQLKQEKLKIKALQREKFKQSQRLSQLRLEEKNLLSDIKNSHSTSIVLNSKIIQLEKDFSKQQEAVYNADFKLQQAEFLVSRGLGERSDQEKRELQQRIQELEQEKNSLEDVTKALTTKKRQVEKEITLWQRKSDVSSKRIHEYESEKAELELEISSCESSLLKLENMKDEEMVSHDLVRMEVHRLRDILKDKTVSIHNLQQERNQLEESFKESKNDLNFSIDLQIVAIRAAEEERHKSAIELSQRKMATEKLQSKYDTLRIAHRSDEDTNGENSQVFYLISAAQKRADLQREGDQLDSEIQQKEKELSTLKSTLSNIKGQNSALRKSFMKVNPDSHEYKNMSELEEKVKDGYNSLLTNKKQLYSLQKACDSIGRQLKDLDARNLKILKENGCLIDSKKQIDSEIERLLNDEKNALKSIKVQIEMIDPSQKDHLAIIEVQVKEKFADMILMMLLELGKEFPTMNVSIITCLTTCGLEMPREE